MPYRAAGVAEACARGQTAAMTMPHERTRALMQTREFLQALLDSERTHYPNALNLDLAHHALPDWFGPPDDEHARAQADSG